MSKKCIFLDRDGTINVNTNYVNDPADVSLLPHASEGLRILADMGYMLVVVTNQSGIARGYFTEKKLDQVNKRLLQQLKKEGVHIKDILYCPFHEHGTIKKYKKKSDCRKPGPGMLLKAAKKYGIDLKNSYMIGDMASDIGAGQQAGCRASILIRNIKFILPKTVKPEGKVKDLMEAALWIMRNEQRRKKITLSEGTKISSELRKKGKRVVFTNGVFDLLHPGHLNYLRLSKSMGDILMIGINTDASVKSFKGKKRPFNPLKSRIEMLSALEYVDYIIPFGDRDPRRLIRSLKPHIHVKDNTYNKKNVIEYDDVIRSGGKVVLCPRIGNYSTTALVKKISRN